MNARILLIAENDEILGAIPPIVESLGHELIIVADTDAASGLIAADSLDLVLLDGLSERFLAESASDALGAGLASTHTPVIALTDRSTAAARTDEVDGDGIRIFDYVHPPFDATDIAARIAAGIRTRRFQEDLRRAAALDPTTQMLNRSTAQARLGEEISRVIRYSRALACVLIVVEPELSEDGVIALGRIFRDKTRLSDVLCRWSKNSILMLLPETGPFGAVRVAENLRRELIRRIDEIPSNTINPNGDFTGDKITAFFGAAGYLEGDDAKTLLERAERAVREAQSDPRRPVVLARVSRGSDAVRFLAV